MHLANSYTFVKYIPIAAVMSGSHIKGVAGQATFGHSTPATTLNIYSHAFKGSHIHAMANAINLE